MLMYVHSAYDFWLSLYMYGNKTGVTKGCTEKKGEGWEGKHTKKPTKSGIQFPSPFQFTQAGKTLSQTGPYVCVVLC